LFFIIYCFKSNTGLPTEFPSELKLKASIEAKALQLLNVQKKLRRTVGDEIRRIASLEAAGDRATYKRSRQKAKAEREAIVMKFDQVRLFD